MHVGFDKHLLSARVSGQRGSNRSHQKIGEISEQQLDLAHMPVEFEYLSQLCVDPQIDNYRLQDAHDVNNLPGLW